MPGSSFGSSVTRREDVRLVRGEGTYAADLKPEGVAHAVVLRSPHAHARILSVDTAGALAEDGVIAVLTGEDAAAAGIAEVHSRVTFTRPGGAPAPSTPKPLLARDIVRHLGDPVALVVAETREAALAASEAVLVDYEVLPALSTVEEALGEGAVAIWPEAPDNIAFRWTRNDLAGIDAALAASHHVTRLDIAISRVLANPIEPRAAMGALEGGRPTLYSTNQSPFGLREQVARLFSMPPTDLRVRALDVGGSFGMKSGFYREDALVLWASRQLGRPVRWVSDRSEGFVSDDHAREMRASLALGLDADGHFTALKAVFDVNIGAYLSGRSGSLVNNIGGIAGVYRTPEIGVQITAVFSNTVPTAPYRGAGRPEVTYAIERLIDVAARETGRDPVALRRLNLIPPDAMPYKTPLVFTYDTGEFAANMDRAAELADLAGLPARRAAAARRGRLLGLGIANPIEAAGGPVSKPMKDTARVVVRADGGVELHSGAMSVGQGLETALPQLISVRLGIPLERIRYIQGDTDDLFFGRGNGGSSSLSVGGSAIARAVDLVLEKARALAADHLEAAAADLDYRDGAFTIAGTDRSVTLAALAALAEAAPSDNFTGGDPGLSATGEFEPGTVTFPNGCHICEVEIEPETGVVELIRYVSVEELGNVLNPMLVEGQIHGGVAQGIGQAVKEQALYEAGSGQLITGSFMDYGMPLAVDLPSLRSDTRSVPTAVNPLGAKGVGEAGTVGALAATMNAVCDALAPLGVRHLDMPATPERVWRAIRETGRAGAPR